MWLQAFQLHDHMADHEAMDADAPNWDNAASMEELEVCKIILRMAAGEGSKVEMTRTARPRLAKRKRDLDNDFVYEDDEEVNLPR